MLADAVVQRDRPVQGLEQRDERGDRVAVLYDGLEAGDRIGVPDKHRLVGDDVLVVGLHSASMLRRRANHRGGMMTNLFPPLDEAHRAADHDSNFKTAPWLS